MADINWNDWLPTRKNRVIPAIFGGVVVISGIIVGVSNLAYLQGKDLSQGELSTYKAVNGADLPGMTKDLTAINKELRESLKIFDENTTLKAEAISFQT
jgi:hypothetical protein